MSQKINQKAPETMDDKVELMRISRGYWTACGEPDLENQLFLSCLFIGYGASATRIALVGLDPCSQNILETAAAMGMTDRNFRVVIADE